MRNGVLTSLHDHLGALYLRAQQLWHHERPLLVMQELSGTRLQSMLP